MIVCDVSYIVYFMVRFLAFKNTDEYFKYFFRNKKCI